MHNSLSTTSLVYGLATSHALVHADIQSLLGNIAPERLRRRPMASMNSIAWCIWHMLRVEDENIARFVIPDQQVFDTGGFRTSLAVPYRDDGFGMQSSDVTALSEGIDLAQLAAYGRAVQAQGAYALTQLDGWDFSTPFSTDHIRPIVYADAYGDADNSEQTIGFLSTMKKGDWLIKHMVGHSQYHLGEIAAIDGALAGDRYFTW
ncbi:MAG: hypothetical protein RLY87_504 [Chloroflexota bacterium]|jgi:hypothetical protein